MTENLIYKFGFDESSGSVGNITSGSGYWVTSEPFTAEEYPRFEVHPILRVNNTRIEDDWGGDGRQFSLLGMYLDFEGFNRREGGTFKFALIVFGIEIGLETTIRKDSFYE